MWPGPHSHREIQTGTQREMQFAPHGRTQRRAGCTFCMFVRLALIQTAARSSGDVQMNSLWYCRRFISCAKLSRLEFNCENSTVTATFKWEQTCGSNADLNTSAAVVFVFLCPHLVMKNGSSCRAWNNLLIFIHILLCFMHKLIATNQLQMCSLKQWFTGILFTKTHWCGSSQ